MQLRDLSFQGMLVRLLPGQSPDPDQPIEATIHLGGDIRMLEREFSALGHPGSSA